MEVKTFLAALIIYLVQLLSIILAVIVKTNNVIELFVKIMVVGVIQTLFFMFVWIAVYELNYETKKGAKNE